MIIRKGNTGDLPEMRSLFTETITSVCKKDYDRNQIDAWKSESENNERWLEVIENQMVIISKFNGEMTGFCTLDKGSYIDLLFVHKDFQQQGIARRLYMFIEQEARVRNEKKLTADVSKTARPFFEKMGFRIITEQKVNVKGIDLANYKMEKELT